MCGHKNVQSSGDKHTHKHSKKRGKIRTKRPPTKVTTYQGLVTLDQLDNFDGLLVLVHFDRYFRQVGVKVLLGDGIVCEQEALCQKGRKE